MAVLLEAGCDTCSRQAHSRLPHGPGDSHGCCRNNSPLLGRRVPLHIHDGMKGDRPHGSGENPLGNFAWDILK